VFCHLFSIFCSSDFGSIYTHNTAEVYNKLNWPPFTKFWQHLPITRAYRFTLNCSQYKNKHIFFRNTASTEIHVQNKLPASTLCSTDLKRFHKLHRSAPWPQNGWVSNTLTDTAAVGTRGGQETAAELQLRWWLAAGSAAGSCGRCGAESQAGANSRVVRHRVTSGRRRLVCGAGDSKRNDAPGWSWGLGGDLQKKNTICRANGRRLIAKLTHLCP